jgi:hypothetical protein
MYEYAVSSGEGTLIDYGVVSGYLLMDLIESLFEYDSIIVKVCDEDCKTGV